MKTVQLNIQDDKLDLFLKFLSELKDDIIDNITIGNQVLSYSQDKNILTKKLQNALKDVELIENGKLEVKDARDFLDEL